MMALLRLLLPSSRISSLSSSHHHHRCFWYSSLLHFSSIACTSVSSSSSISKNPNPIFIDFLIQTLGFSKTQADSISKRLESRTSKMPQKPDSLVHFLREFGFSETQIRKAVLGSPQILSADVEQTLKPKLILFQNELGLTGSHLGLFISKNPALLRTSLEQRLIPNISILKKFIPELQSKVNREGTHFITRRRCYDFFSADPKILLSNISFLQSCGIVGDQLSNVWKRNPSLFSKRESAVRDLICKAQEMGFSCNSRMLVHALFILVNLSSKTIEKKINLLMSFGFSQEECSAMFRSAPLLLAVSEKKLKLGIQFFDSAGFERKMLVHDPSCLMYSLEKRMIPRLRVFQMLKSKQQQLLNNKCPTFQGILKLTEKSFLEKFVFKLGDNAEELLTAYNSGNALHSLTERN